MKAWHILLGCLLFAIFLSSPIPFTQKVKASYFSFKKPDLTSPSELPVKAPEIAARAVSEFSQFEPGHRLVPVSILVYNQFFADFDEEWEHTLAAINETYGTDYYFDAFSDYTNLAQELPNHDILLIPEQENADNATMANVGVAWTSPLTNFVINGGIVILMAYGTFGTGFGSTVQIYNASELMQINGISRITGSTINLINENDALARGLAPSWTGRNGTLGFNVSEGTVVAGNGSNQVVNHKTIGRGHVVLLGFDLFDRETNSDLILGNAIRLHRHIVFDNSHSQFHNITGNYDSFTADLVQEGFAVSSMESFNSSVFNASDLLVINPGAIPYTSGEVTSIRQFVEQGGGLFILDEWGGSGDELDPILNEFGFYRNESNSLADSDDGSGAGINNIQYNQANLANYSLTLGIGSIEQYAGSGFRQIPPDAQSTIITDSDGTATWDGPTPASGVTCYASLIYERGRIAIGLDADFLRSDVDSDLDGSKNYDDADNALLGINTVRWLSAAGVKERIALFDESHNPLHSVTAINEYLGLANYLTSNGYAVQWMDPFNSSTLGEAHVLVICDGAKNYTTLEIAAIKAFVDSGGGLFLIGDHDTANHQVDPIGQAFGISINNTGLLQDSDDNTTLATYIAYSPENLGIHPILEGVSRIELYNGTAFDTIDSGTVLAFTDTDGTSTWETGGIASGLAVMTTTEFQLGRVVYVADSTFLQTETDSDSDGVNDFYDGDNNLFTVNAFHWLVENRAPDVAVLSPNGNETIAANQWINWTATDPNRDEMTYDLSYSPNGTTWLPLIADLNTSSYYWDTMDVPDGNQYLIRVNASDGILSSQDKSDTAFIIDNHGPSIANIYHDPITVTISAEVTDISGVQSVVVNFTIDSGVNWNSTPMTSTSGSTYYFSTNEISVSTTVVYKLTAVDNSPFSHPSTTATYSFTVQAAAPSTSGPSTGSKQPEDSGEDNQGQPFQLILLAGLILLLSTIAGLTALIFWRKRLMS